MAHAAGLPNPFYAMDTSFQRPGLTREQQFDLVKELGFAGIGWTEQAPEQVQLSVQEMEKRGLKMSAIYCAAKVTPAGQLTVSGNLRRIMEVLKGHGTIIWLHIGGNGPAFSTLQETDPLIKTLRELADKAAENDLRIAIYPHIGEWTGRFADAVKLAKVVNHKAFGVSFNLCHALATGEEASIPGLLEEAKPFLVTMTICGADAGVSGGNWDKLIQTLDKGTYQVAGLLRKARQIGFTGPIGFQGYGIRGGAREILTPTMEAWKKLSAEAAK